MKPQHILGCILLILAFNIDCLSQQCEQTLEDAEQFYEKGLLDDIPGSLKRCIKNGFNKNQKERSYKLLILTYLFLDDMENAESYLLKLLKSNPQFNVTAIDPPEFIYLYNGFRTNSVFSIVVKGGINTSFINTLQINGVDNSLVSYQAYRRGIGFQLGAEVNYRIFNNLEITGEINITNQSFDQIDSLRTTLFTDTERPAGYNFTAIDASENQFWVELPVALKYGIRIKKFYPFVYGGASFKYLLNANLNISRANLDPADIETPQRRVEGPPINLIKSGIRDKYHYNLLAGVGVRYQFGIDYLVLNIRYNIGLSNFRNKDALLNANNELLYRYGYIDNDFKMNSTAISIGYVKPFYKPKKLKRKN